WWGGEQYSAGCLPQHVLRHLSNLLRPRAADPAQDRSAPDPGRRLTAHHDHLGALVTSLLDDPGARGPGPNQVGADLNVLVLVPHLTGTLQRPLPFLPHGLGDGCIERP